MKKVIFFGQATGGNALVWFNLFNELTADNDFEIELLARTECTLRCDFKVYKAYGSKKYTGFLNKINKFISSRIRLPYYTRYLLKGNEYDTLVLQGNYTPKNNLRILDSIVYKTSILNIYGSDYIGKWDALSSDLEERNLYYKVLENVDYIVVNWYSLYERFIVDFPEFNGKVLIMPWGINKEWWEKPKPIKSIIGNTKKLSFLSTRALHRYNNVDKVVEAFCEAFPEPHEHTLRIISAYGCDNQVLDKIKSTIRNYKMQNRIILEVDCWYEGESLIDLYDEADFNICFGEHDQLTISIVYALSRKVQNILSPIDSYAHLQSVGINSPIIADNTNVNSLVKLFKEVAKTDFKKSNERLEKDQVLAREIFDHERTFKKYLELK